ncbi:hypothetical protein VKS41_006477 [Umbelopsis sp. WA50703]
MGSNAKETALIDQFCESWDEIHKKYWPLIYQFKNVLSEEQIKKQMSDLREEIIIPILTKHDQALAKNGTGFYVGDKMSLADVVAADWDKEKKDQPFLHVPVLTEFQEDGSKFVLAESGAINRYLSVQQGLMGSNVKETALIDQFYESWEEIRKKYWSPIYQLKNVLSEEQFNKQMSDLREQTIIPILTKHDQALAKNGTGFYVGDKISLADVTAAALLADVVAAVSPPHFDCNNKLTKETHPHLFALYEHLSTHKIFQTHEVCFPGSGR